MTYFKKRAELFDSLFAVQCFLSNNKNEVPACSIYLTILHLSNMNFSSADIVKVPLT